MFRPKAQASVLVLVPGGQVLLQPEPGWAEPGWEGQPDSSGWEGPLVGLGLSQQLADS